MARVKQDGLSYFPLDVSFFDNRKIKALRTKYGNDGIALYIYLLCEIYRDRGYYLRIDEDFYSIAADDNGLPEDKVGEIVAYFCKNGFFDKSLFEKSILSSVEIQRQYQECMKKRGKARGLVVDTDLWLLDDDENEVFICFENNYFGSRNDTKKSKENESKENESKEKKSARAQNVTMSDEEYNSLIENYGQKQTDVMIKHLSAYKSATGKEYNSDYSAILYWVVSWYEKSRKDNRIRGKTGEPTFDVEAFAKWEFENTYKLE